MVEVSGTVSDACAACHEVYRDKDDEKDRCIPEEDHASIGNGKPAYSSPSRVPAG